MPEVKGRLVHMEVRPDVPFAGTVIRHEVTEREAEVLVALADLGETTGAAIIQRLDEQRPLQPWWRGRPWVYRTLRSLERRGILDARWVDGTSARGWRPAKLYRLSGRDTEPRRPT